MITDLQAVWRALTGLLLDPACAGCGAQLPGSRGPACPALPVLGILTLHILPPLIPIASGPIPAGGSITFPTPIPAAAAFVPGLTLDFQAATYDPATGALGATEGLRYTLALP